MKRKTKNRLKNLKEKMKREGHDLAFVTIGDKLSLIVDFDQRELFADTVSSEYEFIAKASNALGLSLLDSYA